MTDVTGHTWPNDAREAVYKAVAGLHPEQSWDILLGKDTVESITDAVLAAIRPHVVPAAAVRDLAASHEHEDQPDCDERCDTRAEFASELRGLLGVPSE